MFDFLTPEVLTFLVPILAFLAVGGLFFGIFNLVNGRKNSVEARLDLFSKAGVSQTTRSTSLASVEIWKDDDLGKEKSLLEQWAPKLPSLEKFFQQADVNIRPSAVAGISAFLLLFGISICLAFQVPVLLAIIPGIILAAIPWFIVHYKRKNRLKQFMAQMPDGLELLARALRAGQSLVAGFQIISEEMPPPISTEFGRVFEEQNLGVQLEEALKAMCERVPNLDLRFLVNSIIIQRQTGGDLAEILDKIGHLIRERFKIWGQIQALTGEGRLSGTVLIALPFVMLIVVMQMNYEYASKLWTTETGRRWSVYALIMQLLGALVIRKIINIKV